MQHLMTNRILLAIAFFLIFLVTSLPAHAATVRVEVVHSQDRYAAGKDYLLGFRLSIQKPWFIHGTEAREDIIPTTIRFEHVPGISIEGIRFPVPERRSFDYIPEPLEVFSGEILVLASLRVSEKDGPGERTIGGRLSYQACSQNACLPPEEISIPVSVSVAAPGTKTSSINSEILEPADRAAQGIPAHTGGETALWLTLIGLFFGGLALNLTPCIYPLIPITISYFTGRAKRRTRAVILHAVLYMVGLATTNAVLGLSAALSGGMLGSVLQRPLVLFFVSLIMIALAMSFFGLWELRIPPALMRFASKDYEGSMGSLFMGLTLGIVAAPCIGPFILGLLTYVGQRGDPFLGFLYFFVLSLGLGMPLSILALFSGAVSKLPLSGDWMLWVRKCMGWVLVGMAAYIGAPIIPSSAARNLLLAGVALAAAVHLALLDRTGVGRRSFLLFKRGAGLALAIGALISLALLGQGREGIGWIPYNENLLLKDSMPGKPVMLEFYADWCSPCRVLDEGVFRDPEVIGLSRKFLTLRVDLTTRQKRSDEILARFRIRGVPTIIFLDKEGKEQRELRIESLVGRNELLDRMNQSITQGR